MDRTLAVLEQRAAHDGTSRLEPDDGDPRVAPDISLAVFVKSFQRGKLQLSGDVEYIFWVQQDILPLNTAFAALVAVEPEGIVEADMHFIEVVRDIF